MKRRGSMRTKNRHGERIPRVRCVSACGPRGEKVPGALKLLAPKKPGQRHPRFVPHSRAPKLLRAFLDKFFPIKAAAPKHAAVKRGD